jgi:predicted O-linked N-acetylglucosamine transferase (SPINDLY family)
MEILRQVPHSVLWLQKGTEVCRENLRQEAIKAGIAPERLIFASWLPHSAYLTRYHHADLFLDTFVYNAGSTAISSLSGGLPMLTCLGDTNASRMGASILASANLEEMICQSPEEYQQRAIDLATHPQKLQVIKEKLVTNRDTLPLFNIKCFLRDLETKLTQLWDKYEAGKLFINIV